jgi:hypothetical protein
MTDTTSIIAGALIAGSSLLTAANTRPQDSPTVPLQPDPARVQGVLVPAFQRAIRRAIDDLRGQYPHTGNACTLLQSFDLVAACATSIRTAEFPVPATLAGSEAALASGLDRLLLGHDEREIAFLQDHLLGAAARALRAELAADPAARRAYEEWLSEP